MPLPAAPWYAFAGTALLTTDSQQLAGLLEQLRGEIVEDEAAEARIRRLADALPSEALALEKEYTRLFLNPTGSPCALWQSAYSEMSQLMGPAHDSALEWYRIAGVEPARSNEPADHAGLLLMFFARLLDSGADPNELSRFRREHLVWLEKLADCVARHTALPFYRELMALLRWLVSVEEI